MKNLLFKLFFGFIFAFVLFISHQSSNIALAATRTWDGGGGADTNWSTCANWSGPDICPTSADVASFDATSTNNSTVDSGFTGTVGSITIASGYTGIITLAAPLTTVTTYNQAGGTVNASNQTLTIGSSFTFSSGTFTASSGTTNIGSSLTISGSPIFNANGGTVNFNTSQTSTLSCNNVTFNLVTLSKNASTTIQSNCSLPLGNNPTVTGTINLNGTLSGTGTINGSNTSFNQLNAGAAISGFTGISLTSAMAVTGATLDFSNYTLFRIGANFALTSGSFTAPTGTMVLLSNFANTGGTFNANGGTVQFNINSFGATISGQPTVFYNLTASATNNRTLKFPAGVTTTVLNNFYMNGNGNNKLSLSSSTSGTQWRIDVQGGRSLISVNVSDSNNINSNVMLADSNSVDSGNNTNWSFGSTNISFYLDYPGGNSHITNINPTYRWKKATVTNNSAISKYELYIQPKTSTNTNTGTLLYIDNILPFVGDNKKYAYYPTYTLYDDGDFLNLTPANYKLTPGKYNFRVVAHDSAGNVREESVDFYVDGTSTNNSVNQSFNNSVIPAGNFVALAGRPTSQPVAETPTPEPTFLPIIIPETVKQVVQSNFPWWILILILIILFILFLLWKRRKKKKITE